MSKKKERTDYISNTQENEDTPWWRRTIRNSSFALSMAVIGFFATVFNIYLSSRIAPLAYRIDSIQTTVEAQASALQSLNGLSVAQNDIAQMKLDIRDMKSDLREINKFLLNK